MAQKDCALKYQQWVVRCCVQMRSKFKWAAVLLFAACRPLEIDISVCWVPCAIYDSLQRFVQKQLFSNAQNPATEAGLLFKINPLLWFHGEKIGCHIIHFTLTILEQKCTIQSIWMCHHFSLQIQIACRYADGHSPQSSFWTARAWWPLSTSASCLHSHCASLASHFLPCILIVFCHCIFSLYSHYSIVSL